MASELNEFLAKLSDDPERDQVKSEIEVLQSIYGEDAIRVWNPRGGSRNGSVQDEKIRYEVELCLPAPHDITIRVLVSLPQTYPSSSPPQLQLLTRYIGAYGADAELFGSILRTYISVNGVEWTADAVCVFDGLQNVLERCTTWYEKRLSMEKVGELIREDSRRQHDSIYHPQGNGVKAGGDDNTYVPVAPVELPFGVEIFTAEPISDRKSTFVGRACRIGHPSEVSMILSHLMSDRRISRAAHPIINAWRCQFEGVLHQGLWRSDTLVIRHDIDPLNILDNDDNGETAAGGRLAHLLQILEINNVLVVVTRHFGGIHLGPDRFKHINQAARNALELGGFLDAVTERKNVGRGKKH